MQSIAVILATAFLFYDSAAAIAAMIPIGGLYYLEWEKEKEKQKRQKFIRQFQDATGAIASALSVGYSVENAVRETEKEMKRLYPETARICRELEAICRKLDMNLPIEQALTEFAEEVPQEDVEHFVTVFGTARRTGGDSIRILRETTAVMAEKMETEQEIATAIAAPRLEFRIMSVIPYLIIGYMRLTFPEFMEVLYKNVTGVVIMTVCLGIYLCAYWLGKYITAIEV